jgi:Large polyvalent protein-associated domain 7
MRLVAALGKAFQDSLANYAPTCPLGLLTAEDVEAAKHIIHPHLKPTTLRNGDVVYRLKDGGVVEDSAQAVHVPQVTEAATLLALTLADERFKDKRLIVKGSTEFKIQVAEQSVLKGLTVKFADDEMDKAQQRFVLARELAENEKKQTQAKTLTKPRDQNQGHSL